jgi:alcohol dehydrogenase, propanol-preferring
MHVYVLDAHRSRLRRAILPEPSPAPRQVLIKVSACGLCRTDLHIIDGELAEAALPLVLGHQIVGAVAACGPEVKLLRKGQTVGVPWLGFTCGKCKFCITGRDNLCDKARFTGYHMNGGFAQYAVADERCCFAIPDGYSAVQAAPLLCAGLIGFRALGMTGEAHRIGIYGFGSAAHILIQVARFEQRVVYAFTRPGDTSGQAYARKLGAAWAGESGEAPPEKLDAAIIFAPDGRLVIEALKAVDKGGAVVCAGIHMTDIPSFPYRLLWEERAVRTVANLSSADGERFMELAPRVPVRTDVTTFALDQVNEALDALRGGAVNGSIVIDMNA